LLGSGARIGLENKHTKDIRMSDTYDISNIQIIAKAENLYALIRQIKARPGFYFEADSLSALYHFINGYMQALVMKDIEESESPPFRDFHEFVRRRTKFRESTSGWRNMILSFNNQDEAKALAMFFVLFEAFTTSSATDTKS
jgi:hypothetical protein